MKVRIELKEDRNFISDIVTDKKQNTITCKVGEQFIEQLKTHRITEFIIKGAKVTE